MKRRWLVLSTLFMFSLAAFAHAQQNQRAREAMPEGAQGRVQLGQVELEDVAVNEIRNRELPEQSNAAGVQRGFENREMPAQSNAGGELRGLERAMSVVTNERALERLRINAGLDQAADVDGPNNGGDMEPGLDLSLDLTLENLLNSPEVLDLLGMEAEDVTEGVVGFYNGIGCATLEHMVDARTVITYENLLADAAVVEYVAEELGGNLNQDMADAWMDEYYNMFSLKSHLFEVEYLG